MARPTSMRKNTVKMDDNGPGKVEAFKETEGLSESGRSSDREQEIRSRDSLDDKEMDTHEDQRSRIAERAFLLYEESGFRHGNDVEHWLEAERQIKTLGV